MIDGVPIITMNKTELINTYSAEINKVTGLDLLFSDVDIIAISKSYCLVFSGEDARSTLPLVIVGGGVGGPFSFICSGKSACSTTDCALDMKHCIPGHDEGSCIPCANNEHRCARTVSNSNMLK